MEALKHLEQILKTIWSKFNQSFCKLDISVALGNIKTLMKRSSLEKRVTKFTPKDFKGMANCC